MLLNNCQLRSTRCSITVLLPFNNTDLDPRVPISVSFIHSFITLPKELAQPLKYFHIWFSTNGFRVFPEFDNLKQAHIYDIPHHKAPNKDD